MSDVFKALSDPTRREILRLLKKREMTAGEIAEQFDLSRPTLSGHFNILKQANLVITDKKRTTITYSLNVSVFEETMGAILDFFNIGHPAETPDGPTENVNGETV